MQDPIKSPDIVVVEDNEDEARLTVMALDRIKPAPTVVVIPDGEEAMAKLFGEGRLTPSLILLDLKLPKVHGLEILEALKSSPDTKEISVLVLTSSDHPKDVERSRTLGCSDYLCKPIDWDKYVSVVCDASVRFLPGCTCSFER